MSVPFLLYSILVSSRSLPTKKGAEKGHQLLGAPKELFQPPPNWLPTKNAVLCQHPQTGSQQKGAPRASKVSMNQNTWIRSLRFPGISETRKPRGGLRALGRLGLCPQLPQLPFLARVTEESPELSRTKTGRRCPKMRGFALGEYEAGKRGWLKNHILGAGFC